MSSIEIITTIIASAGGSALIIAGLAAWLGKVWADRILESQKMFQDIDLDLRQRRIQVYAELWKSTAILPKWPRAEDVTYEKLLSFSESLRGWYFERGGMYLSQTTHDKAYSPLQDALADTLKSDKSGPISKDDYCSIREHCSMLRRALAGDINSRSESPKRLGLN